MIYGPKWGLKKGSFLGRFWGRNAIFSVFGGCVLGYLFQGVFFDVFWGVVSAIFPGGRHIRGGVSIWVIF